MARGSALKDCIKVPVSTVTTEPTKEGCYELLTDRYWQVVDGCVLLYKGFSPQCNSNESISKRLVGDTGEVQFLKRVWLPHRCDY
jgi:hypothetical protein